MPQVKKVLDNDVFDLPLAVLLEHGPHRFTLPDVGRAVGLSPSTLIQRFDSKRNLLDRVLARSAVRPDHPLARDEGCARLVRLGCARRVDLHQSGLSHGPASTGTRAPDAH